MQRQIFLFSSVFDSTAESIVSRLIELDRESNEEITMYINSPGGNVNSMFSIIDMMNIVESPIRTIVTGIAASAAAVIAACGKKRLITENARVMIHEVWGFVGGSISDIESSSMQMTKEQEKLLNVLSKRTGKTVDQIKNMIKKSDKYFDAKEAKNFGLVDEVIKEKSAQVLKLSEGINAEGFEITYNADGLSEVPLLKTGSYSHPSLGEFDITFDILKKIEENFTNNVRGIDISIDYTHDNEKGESPAACWIKELEIKDLEDGHVLVGKSEFTPAGREKIATKEYKYSSADFVVDYVTDAGDHVPYVLRGGTLTNRPFIKGLNPIKLSEKNQNKKEPKVMNREAILKLLSEEHGINVLDMEASISSMAKEVADLQNKIKELNALPAQKEEEIKKLKDSLLAITNEMNQKEKESAFNELVLGGKALPAQKEKILNKFQTAAEIKEWFVDAPKVVNMEAVGSGDLPDGGLTESEQTLVNNKILTKDEILKNRSLKS